MPISNHTSIHFILDRSGSMGSIWSDAIGGLNAFIDTQKAVEGTADFSLIAFDTEVTRILDRMPIGEVRPLTGRAFAPRGSTALLDAVGGTIEGLGQRLAATPESQRPESVVLVVFTDGMENASRRFTHQEVADMIAHQEQYYNWQIRFLAAGIEPGREAVRLKMTPDKWHQGDRTGESVRLSLLWANDEVVHHRVRLANKTKERSE